MSEINPPTGFQISQPSDVHFDESELSEALAVAREACDRARAEILPRFRNVSVDRKSDGSGEMAVLAWRRPRMM